MSEVCLRFDFEPCFWQDRNAFAHGCFFLHTFTSLLFPVIMVVVVLVWFVVENDVFFRRRQNQPHHETGLQARFTITIIIIMITSSLPRFTTSLHHEWGWWWVWCLFPNITSSSFTSNQHPNISSYQHHHKSLLRIPRTVWWWCSVLPSSKLSLAENKTLSRISLLPLFWNTFSLVYFASVLEMTMK